LTRSFSRLVGVLVASLLIAPAGAEAAQINGDPLTVATSDEEGRLGASFTGSGLTEFYGGSADRETGVVMAGNAGFVATTIDGQGSVDHYGSRYRNVTATSAPVVTGAGTAADPFRIVQTFRGLDGTAPAVDIRQEITYVNGQTHFRVKADVTNLRPGAVQLRAAMGADLAGGGSDRGAGLFEPGPPRFVAGLNTDVGAVAGLSEVTPWSHYEEGYYGDVLTRADSDPRGGQLADTVDPTVVDNGAAAQWDAYVGSPLPPGGSASYEVDWRFARTYALTPGTQSLNTGDTAKLEVSLTNTAGQPQVGTHIRWAVFGSNNLSGDVRTGADGKASFEYVGANPGSDRITAYVDLNDNGVRDENEPQRDAVVEWTGPDAPTFAREVNVRPVSGTVLVKLPKGASLAKSKWARKAQSGFVRLTDAKQVPVGAQMDATRGRVSMTTAKSPTGGVQTAQFYSGRFQATQSARERGLTEVRMTLPMQCTSNRRGKATAAARKARSRKLWGSGKGRFRTRGRNSSATVRGTTWLQKDTCSTTTTSVKQGVVIVKDFAKRKNVRVKAGRRYVARARKR
jgi:hypothetical protein